MRLILDQNISHKILEKIIDIYPGSIHVKQVNLQTANDITIWQYAKVNNYTIVTFDADFYELSLVKGFPPKTVWLRCRNTSTDYIAGLFINKQDIITDFLKDKQNAHIELF